MPEPTSTVICSSAGPLIGERNSRARLEAPGVSMYGCMSFTACGTSAGSVQPLTRYGPLGAYEAACAAQPSGLAMKDRNFLAAVSLAPSVDFGMYTPAGDQTVSPFLLASVPGRANRPTFLASCG